VVLLASQWPTPMAGTPAQNGNNYAGNNDSSRRLEVILGLRETPNSLKSQWPTPTVADVTGGRKTRSGSRSDEMLLNGLMAAWATPTLKGDYNRKGASEQSGDGVATQMRGASGPILSGSDAPTEKRGAPNPEFACWLMGWTEELTSGALQAIQSYRKSRPRSSRR
jgi:hypothetical protein